MYTAKGNDNCHLRRRKRERPALVTANVWGMTYRSTVYSVQYKGYNLIGVTTVEGGTTRGTVALVYYWIHSSFYTGTVQGWYSTPNWFDRQGCCLVSTSSPLKVDFSAFIECLRIRALQLCLITYTMLPGLSKLFWPVSCIFIKFLWINAFCIFDKLFIVRYNCKIQGSKFSEIWVRFGKIRYQNFQANLPQYAPLPTKRLGSWFFSLIIERNWTKKITKFCITKFAYISISFS